MQNGRIRLGVAAGVLAALTACHHGGSSGPTPTPTASLAFSVQPGAVTAGALFAPAVEVAVLDQNGDLVTVATSVSLSLAGGDGLQGTLSAVAVDGHATFADLSVRKAGAGYTLTASSDGLQPATSAAFDVHAAAPDAAGSDFVATPTTVAVGGQVALAVTLRDAFGNLVPGAEVAFEATGTANAFVQPVGSTDAAGAASGTLTSTKAEAKTLTARSGAVTLSAHPVVTFTAGAADPAGSTLAASPPSAPSDGTAITLTVTVGDRYGNPLAGQAVTFEASGAASIVQPASATSAAGTATGAVSAVLPGAQTISAKVGGTVVAQRDVTFHAMVADAAASSVAAAPASVPADGATTAKITVTIRDAAGRPIPGMIVALDAAPPTAIDHATAATDAAGVAVFQASATVVGDVTFTATVSNGTAPVVVAQRATVSFTVPVATRVTVTGAGGASTINTIGGTLQLSAAVAPAVVAQTVTWSSSAPDIVSVDATTGLATSHAIGQAVIVATTTDGSDVQGALAVSCVNDAAIFAKQANGTTIASSAGGTIAVSSSYTTSGMAFAFQSGGYYGTSANGFIALPYPLTGDFSIAATVRITATVKGNATTGLGVGVTTGFDPSDRYAFALLNAAGAGALKYVSAASQVGDATVSPAFSFATGATGTAVQVTFRRTAGTYAATFGGTSSASVDATALTDGTKVFGSGAVYPALSFNDVDATITSLVIKDGAGNTLFDAASGSLLPAGTLVLPSTPTVVTRGDPATTFRPAATALGGGAARVAAVAADPSLVDVAVATSTITLGFLKPGVTALTVTNLDDSCPATRTRTMPLYIQEFGASADYAAGELDGRLSPPHGASAAYADGELSLTFDAAPALSTGGSIDIYAADGARVDRIFFAGETQTLNASVPKEAVTINVGSQLVRVGGNSVYFTPHWGKLKHGTTYYVAISTTSLTGTLAGRTFKGFSNQAGAAAWVFTTRPAPAFTGNATITVDGASTGAADFRSLGGALRYLAENPISGATEVGIQVASGTYTELVNYRPLAANAKKTLTITISGPAGNDRGAGTVFQYTNGGSWNGGTSRASFYFAGANLVLENLTFKNTGVRAQVAQAEALHFASGSGYTLAANNCTFSSYQDTVQTSGRAWIYNSIIEGNTDFIWGTSDVALFEGCTLRVISDRPGQTYAIFVARTGKPADATIGKGYVLKGSTVNVDGGITASYARNAGTGKFYDQVALLGNTFQSAADGKLLSGLWQVNASSNPPIPQSLGNGAYVGWKSAGNTGMGADTAPAAGTSATVAEQATEYDTRDHILNRVVNVAAAPYSYADVPPASVWNLTALQSRWNVTTP